jgi:hypothetical protein
MKMTIAKLLFVLCVTGMIGHTPPANSQTANDDVFSHVRPLLLRETHVPLRVPDLRLAYEDKVKALYVILENAGLSYYEVQIALTKDCPGGNYCHVGTIRGSTASLVEDEGPRVPVTLEKGIKGYFIDATCAAFCDDSSLGWEEGGYHYSISLKAAKMRTLVKLANSAIVSGQRGRF